MEIYSTFTAAYGRWLELEQIGTYYAWYYRSGNNWIVRIQGR